MAELVSQAGVAGGQVIQEALKTQSIVARPSALAFAPGVVVPPRGEPVVSTASIPVTINQSVLNADIQPAVQHLLASVVDTVTYVGAQAAVAATLATALIESEPKLVVDTLAALARGDFRIALHSAVQAVLAPVSPAGGDGVFSVVSAARQAKVAASPVPSALVARQPTAADLVGSAGHRRQSVVAARSAAGSDDAGARSSGAPNSSNGATDLSNGNKVSPRSTGRPARVRENVTAAVDTARTALGCFGDTVRNAVGPRSHTDSPASPNN